MFTSPSNQSGFIEFFTLTVGGQPIRIIIVDGNKYPLTNHQPAMDLTKDQLLKLTHHDSIAASPTHLVVWQHDVTQSALNNITQINPEMPGGFLAEAIMVQSVVKTQHHPPRTTSKQTVETNAGTITCEVTSTEDFGFRCRLGPMATQITVSKQEIGVPGIGLATVSVVFAGGFYLLAEANSLGIGLNTSISNLRKLEDSGMRLMNAAPLHFRLHHPYTLKPTAIDGVIFMGTTENIMNQAVVYQNGTIGRSAGLAASVARMAFENATTPRQASESITDITGNKITIKPAVDQPLHNEGFVMWEVEANVILTESGYINPANAQQFH